MTKLKVRSISLTSWHMTFILLLAISWSQDGCTTSSSEWKKQRVKGKNLLPFKQLSPTQRFLLPRTGQNSTTGISSCKAGWEIFYVHVSTTLKLRCVV